MDELQLEMWKEDDKVFIETRAYNEVMTCMHTKKCVAIMGGPGAGKVTTARHCALVLQKEGWKIVAVSCVKQLRQKIQSFSPKYNSVGCVFLLENPIGRCKLNLDECEGLKKDQSFLESMLNSTKVKIIFTARRSIYKEAKCLSLFIFHDKYIIDLESKDLQLNSEEMTKIFVQHCFIQNVNPKFMDLHFRCSESDAPRLQRRFISKRKLRGIPSKIPASAELDFNEYPMFPLLCKIYASNYFFQIHGISFFKEPCDILIKELEEMCLFEMEKYSALVLCMLNGNVVTEETYENQELLRDVFKVCGEIPIRKIQEAYAQMQGTFIVKVNYGFSISPDILFEVLACKHASDNPKHLLKYMNSDFILSHLYLSRTTVHSNPALSVFLPGAFFTELSERLYSDLQQKKYEGTFNNECMKDREFQCFFADFLNRLDCREVYKMFLTPLSEFSNYVYTNSSINEEFTKVDIYKLNFKVNQRYDGGVWVKSARGINWVIGYGHCDVLLTIVNKSKEYLSSHQGIFGSDTTEQVRMLSLGSYSKNVRVVEVVLKYVDRCCIDSECEGTYTPLTAACQTGNGDIVECLILAGANVNRSSKTYYNVRRTPLIVAVEYNHLHLVKLLLKHKADINECSFEMESPYDIACRLGNYSIADFLRANGADVNTTALIRAIKNSHRNAIKLLLKRKHLINKADSSGMTPLHWALQRNDLVSVEQLVGSAQLTMDHHGSTPSHMACCSGFSSAVEVFNKTRGCHRRIEKLPSQTPVLNELIKARKLPIIKYLLYHGADPNHINEGELPLCIACAWGDVFIVNCLLNYSANVNECDNVYGSPLHAAAQNGRLTITGVLLRYGACSDVLYKGLSPLHIAAKYGYFDVVRCLVENGSNVNSKDGENLTAFHHAANENHLDIAKYLVKKGADIVFSDIQEKLLIRLLKNYDVSMCLIKHGGIVQKAVAGNRLDIIKLLVEKVPPVARPDIFCDTPINFILATEKGNIEMIEYFIRNGVDVNAPDTNGQNPLFFAIVNDHYEIVNILLDHGASTAEIDILQRTPLHWVAERECHILVDTLIVHGSKVNAQDIEGKTPLHKACECSNLLLVKKLSDNGGDISIRDNDGYTPIDTAFMNEERHIYEYLIRLLRS